MTDTAVSLGSNVGWYFSQSQLLIVLGPEHAQTIANDGFSRADVQRFVFEHARLSLRTLKLGGCGASRTGRVGCSRSPTTTPCCRRCRHRRT